MRESQNFIERWELFPFYLHIKMANEEKLQIAIFPWLANGQVMPYFELSKFLAQKDHKVSFISAPKNIRRLPNLLSLINLVEHHLPYINWWLASSCWVHLRVIKSPSPIPKKKSIWHARAPSDSINFSRTRMLTGLSTTSFLTGYHESRLNLESTQFSLAQLMLMCSPFLAHRLRWPMFTAKV